MSAPPTAPPRRREAFGPLHVFFVVVSLLAGCMFVFKLFEFLRTIERDELAGFAYDPIIVYGLVAMGFLLLLGWAYLSGQFRDIERPKYELFERLAEQEGLDISDVLDEPLPRAKEQSDE